jgi:acetylornithine/succinyldiaminopimelate/putrescine aminotransferase
LRALARDYPVISEVRGRGLMVGAEVGADAAGPLVQAAREEGLLINSAGGHTLRFVPPLIVSEADVDEALQRLGKALSRWSEHAS